MMFIKQVLIWKKKFKNYKVIKLYWIFESRVLKELLKSKAKQNQEISLPCGEISFIVHLSELSERKRAKQKPPAMQVEEISFSFKLQKASLLYNCVSHMHNLNKEVELDKNSLSHTKRRCKYHIVFAPKYRRQVIYSKLKKDIGIILRELCSRKGINIIEAELCPDHVHMLIEIPPKLSVSETMGYLKGKSSLIIFDRHANLKYKYGNRHFWCRGYYVDTVGRNEKKIKEYIQNQLKEDYFTDQISIKEYYDPFTGESVKKNK